MPLDEFFPNLKIFHLDVLPTPIYGGNHIYVACEFPHLEELHLEAGMQSMHGIDAFLSKNPQIKRMNVEYLPQKSLKFLPELLPNIENLCSIWSRETFQIENSSG